MCLMYYMVYEFNNWRAFYDAVKFVMKRHINNYPKIRIEVPKSLEGRGWGTLGWFIELLKEDEPEDLEEMSIYGKITFLVTKDENLNQEVG